MYNTIKWIADGCWLLSIVLLFFGYVTEAEGEFVWFVGIIAVVGVLLRERAAKLRLEENKSKPVTTVNATIMSHRTESRDRWGYDKRYYVKFLIGQEKLRLELELPKSESEALHPGDTGVLRYRDWEYLSFVPGQRVEETILPPVETKTIQMQEVSTDDGILTHEIDE